MPLRVAIVTRFPKDPRAPHGGVESVGVTLARALSRLDDLEVHVVTTESSETVPHTTAWRGVTVHRLPQQGRRMLQEFTGPGRRRMKEYLIRLAPDVVHAHDTYGLMVKGLKIPHVFTVHGFIHMDTRLSGQRLARLRSWVWRHLERRGWADYPHIISISPYVRERLTGIAKGAIHDIDNPVSDEFFRIRQNKDERRVFSAALISPVKNTLALLAGFARLVSKGVDAELRLAGAPADSRYYGRVRRFIYDRRLTDRIALLGELDTAQVRHELAAARVFALTSLQENAPMAIGEAMAAGVPAVASNRCGMPYMVRDGESGFLVDPHDPDDIAWRLRQVLEDDALRSAMSEKSREIARDRFHPMAVARRTREVYLRAVRGSARGNGRD